ncbi:MAG: DUF6468 domain-containing protein [Rhodospirillales bacterium]|jgi:hypothetical protein
MTGEMVGIVLDILIIGLLGATIYSAYILNKRLDMIRKGRAELEALVRGFADATQRAEAGVTTMKRLANDTGEQLLKQIDRARALRDELQIMIETGDSLCSRLESAATRAPQAAARPAQAAPPAGAPAPAAAATAKGKTGAVAARPGQPAVSEDDKAAAPVVDTLSRAERELLQVIEKLR